MVETPPTPVEKSALYAQIAEVVAAGKHRKALDLTEGGLARWPQDVLLQLRKTVAMRKVGRRAEALALARDLHEKHPDNRAVTCELATALRQDGDAGAGLALVDRLVAADPHYIRARTVQIAALLDLRQGARALEAARIALETKPDHLEIALFRATALQLSGEDTAATAALEELAKARPRNVQVAMALGDSLRKTGAFAAADRAYQSVLKTRPRHTAAWLGRIDCAVGQQDIARADALCAAARDLHPQNRAFIMRQCQVFQMQGKMQSGVALLTQALEASPDDAVLRSRLAHFHFLNGAPEAANAVLAHAPEGYRATDADLLRQADAANGQGRTGEALRILGDGIGVGAGPIAADVPPPLALKYCELALQAGDVRAVPEVLGRMIDVIGTLQDGNLARLVKLGERAEQMEVALAAIREVALRDRINPFLAQFLLRRGHLVMDADGTNRLAAALERKLAVAQRAEFRVFTAAVISGPDAALAVARAEISGPATLPEVVIVAAQVLGVGRPRLAIRYMRRALRRWPNDAELRRTFLLGCISIGDLAAGHAMLDALQAANPEVYVDSDRIELLVQGGHHQKALDILEDRQARGFTAIASVRAIELYLALGRYDDARAIEPQVRGALSAGRQTANHFGATLVGSRLKELGLYRDDVEHLRSTGMKEDAITRQLTQKFFYPAKSIIDDWMARTPTDAPRAALRQGDIPRRVMQYWNTPVPPQEVQAVMQSWQVTGFEHTVYDRLSALAFLRKHFGANHVRAFSLANSVAEECDFLRLCLLYQFGGIYADADDRLNSDLQALLDHGTGMIVSREMLGAIANNMICARPRHPVLKTAISLAGRSLLNRENDNTWSKTGPGLMTRAVALYLHDTLNEEARGDLTIIPEEVVRRHIQPHVRLAYKSTAKYWNASDTRVPEQIIAALSAMT